jgi:tetratricopeptide (TPR) repeat protein
VNSSQNVASKLDGATLAMASGNLPAVERISREVLAIDPNVAQAHVLLGIVAQRTGRPSDAIQHLTRAYELQPTSFEAVTCLAAAYRLLGDTEAAIPFAELAAKLRPSDARAQADLGSMYLESLRLQDAEKHLRKAVSLSGGGLHMLLALNQCLDREGKSKEATDIIRWALQNYQISLDELLNFAPLMISQNNPTGAVEASRVAVRIAPKSLRARAHLARSLIEAGRGDEAFLVLSDSAIGECANADSRDSEALTMIGMAFQSLGRVEDARDWLRRAIEAPNPVSMAYYGFTHSGKITEEDRPLILQMEARLGNPSKFPDPTSICFALGKSYEDLGDYAKAMSNYEAANHSQISGQATFDRKLQGSTADDAYRLFTRDFFVAHSGHGSLSEVPIIVVGMMRSGTTLVEQILSNHPEIGGAGEIPFWTYNAPDVLDLAGQAIRSDRMSDAAERYLSLLTGAYPDMRRVVDKMPANYKYLGIIHLAFPNARIIHMRRNPVDTCISIYSTHSRALNEHGNAKADLVRTYQEYQSIVAHWRAVLPADRFLDVDYESVVGNSEPTIRHLVEFCGLEWNDACLRPESNPHVVSTPSLWQVRRPINAASVERWRRFEPWLGEFKDLF